MSKLVIVESPNKIKSIQKYLGEGYSVMASKGHVRDLPKSSLGIDIDHGFTPNYKNMPDKKEVIKSLKAAASEADFVYLATDPDREGEAISWHLAQILGLSLEQNNRVYFNEITKTGIKNGMAQPRKLNLSLVNAQQARRVLDRIVGYKLSPFLWKKVKSGLSAGRVQSVALRMMVDREREIEAFVPQEYWTIDADLKKGNSPFTAKFYGRGGEKMEISNGQQAALIEKELKNADYTVSNLKKSDKNRQPAPPFTTSTMQQEAARRFGFTGQRTMRVAQSLYEGVNIKGHGFTGLITYMRTDSLRISEEARAQANDVILDKFGKKYLPEKPRYFKSKATAQDAHEAIRPSVPSLAPSDIKDSLTSDQYKLYKLIWDRFIASLMANEVLSVVSVDIAAGEYNFKAGKSDVKFDGFSVLYTEGKDEDDAKSGKLPELAVGDRLTVKEIKSDKHYTQPPSRYSEATLIKALDENGIGRPSTYAPILSNIISKDYIERDKKTLKPTALGMIVIDLLKDNFNKIVDTKFTASMEESLDKIEEGEYDYLQVVNDFYKYFEKILKGAEEKMEGKKIQVPVEETDEICELCGKKMVVRSGRFGKFLACPGYPECKNTKPLPENEIKQPCPKCGGKLVSRISKKGKRFYGCSNYPNCDFAAPSLPTGEVCKECGSFILKGARGKDYCQNADCPTRKTAEKAEK